MFDSLVNLRTLGKDLVEVTNETIKLTDLVEELYLEYRHYKSLFFREDANAEKYERLKDEFAKYHICRVYDYEMKYEDRLKNGGV